MFYVDLSCQIIKAENPEEAEKKVNEMFDNPMIAPVVCNIEPSGDKEEITETRTVKGKK